MPLLLVIAAAEFLLRYFSGIMTYEPAVEMVHDAGGTTLLLEVYTREDQSSKNAAKINENAYKALKTMREHATANEMILDVAPDFDWSIDLGGKP
eukprot:COSAG05_NODE_359_length_10803_cov_14.909193_8_plen_95_part_00